MRSERRSRPWRLAARLPVSRQARTERSALAADDPKSLGGSASRHATSYRRNEPGAQILRQGFRHACWPPRPADSVNHIRAPLGIPCDSIRSDFALAGLL